MDSFLQVPSYKGYKPGLQSDTWGWQVIQLLIQFQMASLPSERFWGDSIFEK